MNSGELLTSDTILETPPNSSTSWVTYTHVNRHNNYAKHRNEHHFSVLKSALSEFAVRASAGMIWIHIFNRDPLKIRLSFESMLTSDNLRNTFHSNWLAKIVVEIKQTVKHKPYQKEGWLSISKWRQMCEACEQQRYCFILTLFTKYSNYNKKKDN